MGVQNHQNCVLKKSFETSMQETLFLNYINLGIGDQHKSEKFYSVNESIIFNPHDPHILVFVFSIINNVPKKA